MQGRDDHSLSNERRNHQLLQQSVRRFRDNRNLYCSEHRNYVEWDEYNGRGVGSVIGQAWKSTQGERHPCPKNANMLRYMRTCEGLLTVSGLERKVAKPGFSQAPAALSRFAFKERCRENAYICLSRDLLPSTVIKSSAYAAIVAFSPITIR